MAYTPLADVQDGDSLGANLWNMMSRATGIGVGMITQVGDFITAVGLHDPSILSPPANPNGQVLASLGNNPGWVTPLAGDRSGDFTPAHPGGSTSNDSRLASWENLRRTFVGA